MEHIDNLQYNKLLKFIYGDSAHTYKVHDNVHQNMQQVTFCLISWVTLWKNTDRSITSAIPPRRMTFKLQGMFVGTAVVYHCNAFGRHYSARWDDLTDSTVLHIWQFGIILVWHMELKWAGYGSLIHSSKLFSASGTFKLHSTSIV